MNPPIADPFDASPPRPVRQAVAGDPMPATANQRILGALLYTLCPLLWLGLIAYAIAR